MKHCPECGQELRLAHGIWSHVQECACKVRFIRATESERAAQRETPPPIRRRAWGEQDAASAGSRFGYLAPRSEPTGPRP